ncbi:MAG TPA: hypothetical protein VMZ71_11750 [Gemmataceae bacterium]|nr:hypothetical protein [Gemmataceae bacterium]
MNSPSVLVVSTDSKWSNSVWGAVSLTVAVVVSLAHGSQILPIPLGGAEVFALTLALAGLGVALIARDVVTNRGRACYTHAPAPGGSRASFTVPAPGVTGSRANVAVPTQAVVSTPVESEPFAEELREEAPPVEIKHPPKFTKGPSSRSLNANGPSPSSGCHVVLSSAQYQFRKGDVREKI